MSLHIKYQQITPINLLVFKCSTCEFNKILSFSLVSIIPVKEKANASIHIKFVLFAMPILHKQTPRLSICFTGVKIHVTLMEHTISVYEEGGLGII